MKFKPSSIFLTGLLLIGAAQFLGMYRIKAQPSWGPYPQTSVTFVTVNTTTVNVSGKASFNQITITNQLAFTTNAFPLAAGTVWDWSKPYQLIQTNASFVVTGPAGLTNYLMNWAVLTISNSGASSITIDLTALKAHYIGPNTTNSIVLASGKMAIASASSWGTGVFTNLVTAVEP